MTTLELIIVIAWAFYGGAYFGAWWAMRDFRKSAMGAQAVGSLTVTHAVAPPTHVFPDGGDGKPAMMPRRSGQ